MENEELNLDDLDQIESNADKKQLQINRYQQLANDKRALSQEKDELTKQKAEAEAKLANLEKERDFLKTFSQLSSKHPEATNYQDQILERVNKGMDAEEATIAVLYKEGKLTQAPPQQRTPMAEGGSAVTNVNVGEKPLDDLSMVEKLNQLKELEKSGELQQALRQGINRT